EAEAVFKLAIEHLTILCKEHDDTVAYQRGLGEVHGLLGELYARANKGVEARMHLEKSLHHLGKALDADPKQPRYVNMRRENYRWWLIAMVVAKDHAETAKATPELVRLFPKGEGTFLAVKFLTLCLTLVDEESGLSTKDRTAFHKAYADRAVELLSKTSPSREQV